jgi:hypothetical protein
MNDIEDRLREELKEFAQRAQPEWLRPLRPPAPRRRTRTARWLAPVAAAIAVVAAVAGATLAGHTVAPQPASRPPVRIPAYPGMPRYYVVVTAPPVLPGHPVETADVYDTVTGRLLDKIPVPEEGDYGGDMSVSAAANDREFVISGTDPNLFLLQLTADGQAEGLQTLPVEDARQFYPDPALSPDGSRIAYMARVCENGGCVFGIAVMPVGEPSEARFWVWKGLSPQNLSWAPGGKQVMFRQVWGHYDAQYMQYRLLNVTGPGGNLLTDSQTVGNLPVAMRGQFAMLLPGARTVIGSTGPTGLGQPGVTGEIVEMSRGTGKLRPLYLTMSPGNGDCGLMSLAPTGVQPIVSCNDHGGGNSRGGLIEDGRFIPRPGMNDADAAW